MEQVIKNFMEKAYFKLDANDEIMQIKNKLDLPEDMKRYFPRTMDAFTIPDKFEVPKQYVESFSNELLSKLTPWSRNWAKTRGSFLQKLNPQGEIESSDAAILYALENVVFAMNLLTSSFSDKSKIIPINLFNSLWGELYIRDRFARYMLRETEIDTKFVTFNWLGPKETMKDDDQSFPNEEQILLERMRLKKFFVPGSLKNCSTPVRKDANFGLVRLEVRNFSKDGALEAFIGDNIIQIWNCINSLNRDTEEQEDSIFLLVKYLHQSQQKGGINEELYQKIKLTTDQLAEEIRPLVTRKQFPYEPLPKKLEKAEKISKKKFGEPIRRSIRERKIRSLSDDESKDKENKPSSAKKLKKMKKSIEDLDSQSFGLANSTKRNIASLEEVDINPEVHELPPKLEPQVQELPPKLEPQVRELEPQVQELPPKLEPQVKIPKREKRTSKPAKVFTPPHWLEKEDPVESSSEAEESDTQQSDSEFEGPAHKKRKSNVKPRALRTTIKQEMKESKTEELDIIFINEGIFLEETKLSLFTCRKAGGGFFTNFIPTILESIDRASIALSSFKFADYIIHKTAIETGVIYLMDCLKRFKEEQLNNVDQESTSTSSSPTTESDSGVFDEDGYRVLRLEQL